MNNQSSEINILIIDDHTFLKEGVESRIKQVFPSATCFFTTNIKGALVKVIDDRINLVLCDLEFDNDPAYDGFYFIKSVINPGANTKVIAFTNYNSYRIMNKARKAGFSSYLLKTCSYSEFSDTLVNVMERDDEYISISMKSILKKRDNIKTSMFSDSLYGVENLSKSELELVILSAKTTNRHELAKIIYRSAFTVDSLYKKILIKLNIKSRKEVQFFAIEFMDELLKRKNQSTLDM